MWGNVALDYKPPWALWRGEILAPPMKIISIVLQGNWRMLQVLQWQYSVHCRPHLSLLPPTEAEGLLLWVSALQGCFSHNEMESSGPIWLISNFLVRPASS